MPLAGLGRVGHGPGHMFGPRNALHQNIGIDVGKTFTRGFCRFFGIKVYF
jgi:hypothetical protein